MRHGAHRRHSKLQRQAGHYVLLRRRAGREEQKRRHKKHHRHEHRELGPFYHLAHPP